MSRLRIPNSFLEAIVRQAEREYPHECCGMVMSRLESPEVLSRVRPCRNVYDQYHALDPENFPRSARTAYFMDPRELLEIQKQNRRFGEEIRIIYHSHIDADAYFSEEDERIASSGGSPTYPGTDHLVVSVFAGKVRDWNLFRWDGRVKRHVK